jgi:hypothetical protein
MESPEKAIQLAAAPAERGRFSWIGLIATVGAAGVFGVVWAYVAEVAQSYYAPLILFPILLGVFAGLSIVGWVRFARVGHRPTILLAAVLTAVVAAVGQHGFGYLAAYDGTRSSIQTDGANGQDMSALIRQMRPGFGKYMQAEANHGRPLLAGYKAQGWVAWLSWAADALLMAAAAVVVSLPALRVSYCNRCGSWYRTIRSGKIDQPTALRLAEQFGVEEIEHLHSPRYRLSACLGGCSPTRCELSWEDAHGAVELVQVWLDPAGRNQVATILDGLDRGEGSGKSEE